MKVVSATDFKAHCLELIDEVAATGETIVVTKHGRPKAELRPTPVRKTYLPGAFSGTAQIVGDLVEPLGIHWEGLDDPG